MTLQTSSDQRTTAWQKLGIAVLIAVAILAVMALATAILGVQAPGPLFDIVPDPAGLSGLPF
jgi:hypothetical protein